MGLSQAQMLLRVIRWLGLLYQSSVCRQYSRTRQLAEICASTRRMSATSDSRTMWGEGLMNKLVGICLAPLIIVPLILLVSGAALKGWPPENINSVYGFRTRESSRSPAKWKEANRLMANHLLVGSLVLAVLNSVVFLCTAFASEAVAERVYRATPFWMIGSFAVFAIVAIAHVQHSIKSIN